MHAVPLNSTSSKQMLGETSRTLGGVGTGAAIDALLDSDPASVGCVRIGGEKYTFGTIPSNVGGAGQGVPRGRAHARTQRARCGAVV